MIESVLLRKLKELQIEYSLQSLQTTNKNDAFEYGYRSGVVGGIEKSIGILINLLEEEKHGNPDL